MTDQQLQQGQEIKRMISLLTGELEKFGNSNPAGINVYLPAVGELIDDVKQVFVKHLNEYNRKFKEL